MHKALSTPVITDPAQSLCVQCGLCCDGTIFEHAQVFPEDDLAQLETNGFILLTAAEKTSFALPCHHQQDRVCTIYQQWRPTICHTFRCALLRRFDAGELAWEEAHAQIERTVALAERIRAQLPVPGEHERRSLKQRMSAWQQAQRAAGVDVQRAFAPLLLDFVSLQRLLDLHFRLKPKQVSADAMSAPDTNRFNAQQGADHE